MDTGIHVGNDNLAKLKKSLIDAAKAIDLIFDSAHRNHIDQPTVIQALNALSAVASVHNVTITQSTITSKDRHVHFADDDDV